MKHGEIALDSKYPPLALHHDCTIAMDDGGGCVLSRPAYECLHNVFPGSSLLGIRWYINFANAYLHFQPPLHLQFPLHSHPPNLLRLLLLCRQLMGPTDMCVRCVHHHHGP